MSKELQAFQEALHAGSPNNLTIDQMASDVFVALTLEGWDFQYLIDFFS